MQWPNLPTDNLYKLVALSGVAVLIAAQYFTVVLTIDLQDRSESLARDAAAVDADSKRAANAADWLREQVDAVKAAPDDQVAERIDLLRNDAHEIVENVGKVTDSVQRQAAVIIETGRQIERRAVFTMGAIVFDWLLTILGLGMAVWGFRRWYYRVQAFQDALLRAEFDKMNREHTEASRYRVRRRGRD